VDGTVSSAYLVELQLESRSQLVATRYLVDAETGRILERRDLTARAFSYRVWAEADLRPLDGPAPGFSPHPTGLPDGSYPALSAAGWAVVEGLNVNPSGMSDPWLASSATQTSGNGVNGRLSRPLQAKQRPRQARRCP
jgi:hypothetical protein